MPRAREFDTEVALERCLPLFWRKGFAGVSIRELEEATGLGRQSLYSAFGNKEALYAAVLERYSASTEAWLAPLFAADAGLHSLRAYAAGALAAQRSRQCSGCLVVKTLFDHGIAEPALVKRAQAATRRVRAAFEHALERAQARDEIRPGDNRLRADLCFAAINGLGVLRRSGVPEAKVLAALEPLLESFAG